MAISCWLIGTDSVGNIMPTEPAVYLRWLRTAFALLRGCVLVLATLGAVLTPILWSRGYGWITWIRDSKAGNGRVVYALNQHHSQLFLYRLTEAYRTEPDP